MNEPEKLLFALLILLGFAGILGFIYKLTKNNNEAEIETKDNPPIPEESEIGKSEEPDYQNQTFRPIVEFVKGNYTIELEVNEFDKNESEYGYDDFQNKRTVFLGSDVIDSIPGIQKEQDYDRTIFSSQNNGKQYIVNLFRNTCTCPDFVERKSNFPSHSFKRYCKHLKVYLKYYLEINPDLMRNFGFFINDGKYPNDFYTKSQFTYRNKSFEVHFGWRENSHWISVITPINGTFTRFSYSIFEMRWSYGTAPLGSTRIEKFIKQNFGWTE